MSSGLVRSRRHARAQSIPVEYDHADVAVAEALAAKPAVHREAIAERNPMRPVYTVAFDSWATMTASLLAQIIAKVIDVPRSTLGAWVNRHKTAGTWPV